MTMERFKHQWLLLSDMEPHPKIQRQFRKGHAERIAAEFDPDCFGELYVIPHPRKKGRYWIFDGQHRWWAAQKALGAGQKVYCRIYEERNLERLAKITVGLNGGRKQWQAIDLFMQRLNAQDPQAGLIRKILAERNLHVDPSYGEGAVRAVGACDWVIAKAGGPHALQRVIGILHGAWGPHPDAYHQVLIKGMALLCNRYNSELKDGDLISGLKKRGGPGGLVGRSRDLAKTMKESISRATARVLVADYNRARRSNRLPDWS